MGQINQGGYVKRVEEIMPAYSQATVTTSDGQIFTGEGYLHGLTVSIVSTGLGNGTIALHDGTSTSAAMKLYVENDATLEGKGSKVVHYTSPLRFSSGMLADLSNVKASINYRK